MSKNCLEDYVETVKKEDGTALVITDMKAFGKELTKMICDWYHIKQVPKVSIISEEEYRNKDDVIDRKNEKLEVSFYHGITREIVIIDESKNKPIDYGEEISYCIRETTKPSKFLGEESVNEFFGFLGQMAAYQMIYQKKPFKDNIEGYPDVKLLSKLYSKNKLAYEKNCSGYSRKQSAIKKKIKAIERERKKLSDKIDVMNDPDDNLETAERKTLYSMHDKYSKICSKLSELLRKENKVYFEMRDLKSDVSHAEGYTAAWVLYPIAKNDKHLFYRSDEDIKKIYFEPVMQYDWSRFSYDNPVSKRTVDKVIDIAVNRLNALNKRKGFPERLRWPKNMSCEGKTS